MQQWVSEKQAMESSLASVSSQEEQDRAELSRLQQLLARESQREKILSKKIMVRDAVGMCTCTHGCICTLSVVLLTLAQNGLERPWNDSSHLAYTHVWCSSRAWPSGNVTYTYSEIH